MKPTHVIAVTFAATLAVACASGATPLGMMSAPALEPHAIEAVALADVPTISLRATGGEETNPLHTSQISNDAFREALGHEVLRSGAFRPVYDEAADYHLHVDLAEVDRPYWGFMDMEVKIGANWRLYEGDSGRLVWERRVDSAFTATEKDSDWGIQRLRLANEGSARDNIAEGVGALSRMAGSGG